MMRGGGGWGFGQHKLSRGRRGVYATLGDKRDKSRLCVVVNSAKLFATLSRKMLNFVGGNGDELHEGIPSERGCGGETMRSHHQKA